MSIFENHFGGQRQLRNSPFKEIVRAVDGEEKRLESGVHRPREGIYAWRLEVYL